MGEAFDRSRDEYVLGQSDAGLQRLVDLSRLYRPTTAAWLAQCGIEPGMSVVDLGCGLGEVAEQVAALVGPDGLVLGVDAAAAPLALAREKAERSGLRTVRYVQADVRTWQPDGPVDALVGRCLLMHLPDPVGELRRLAGLVRPGTLLAFSDVVLTTRRSEPAMPLVDAFNGWLLSTLTRLGRPVDMGLRLAAVYEAAALEPVRLTAGSPVERGGDAIGYAVMAGDVRSLLPHMERLGTASAAEVMPETLEGRLREQAAAADALLVSPLLVGASAQVT